MKTEEAIEQLVDVVKTLKAWEPKGEPSTIPALEHAIRIMRESLWRPIDTCTTEENVLVCGKSPNTTDVKGYVCEAFKAGNKFMTDQGYLLNQPTHWRPLPSPIQYVLPIVPNSTVKSILTEDLTDEQLNAIMSATPPEGKDE